MQQADHDLLIRIDANVANLVKNFNAHTESDEKNFTDQDKRLSKIEELRWKECGAISVIVIVAEVVIKAVFH